MRSRPVRSRACPRAPSATTTPGTRSPAATLRQTRAGERVQRHTSQSAAARWEALKTSRVQGIGGITGKALALSIMGGAVYGVIKLVDLVTDDVGAGSKER
jgi:hypothetical protein